MANTDSNYVNIIHSRKYLLLTGVISLALCLLILGSSIMAQTSLPGNESVSLVALIGDGSRYSGREVRVAGWLHAEFEDRALFLTENDSVYNIYTNAIWIEADSSLKCVPESAQGMKTFDRMPIWIVGTFDPSFHGHMNLFSGALRNCKLVTRIYKVGTNKNHVGD